MIRFFALYGFLAFLSNFTEFAPVIIGVPAAVVVLLLYTQPLWTVMIGKIALKENISREKLAASAMVAVGAAFVVWQPFSWSINPAGAVLALAGGLVISLWIIFGRVAGKRDYHPLSTQTGYYIFMLVFLALSYPAVAYFVRDPSIVSFSLSHSPLIWLSFPLFRICHNAFPSPLLSGSEKGSGLNFRHNFPS